MVMFAQDEEDEVLYKKQPTIISTVDCSAVVVKCLLEQTLVFAMNENINKK